ncbi:MAG: aminodeoxychorismate/anthranilate synthase component II [Lentisphaeria bacterium]|nr:aminodeoxychorismate/anthranilate synthase component II [Lentisphaeria bacterium]
MIFVLDNYDSFTFNLVQYLQAMGADVVVRRNDVVTVDEVAAMAPDHILISPGPCSPAEAGISVPLIQAMSGKVPILGVCLGHQSLAAAFGGAIVSAKKLMHGKVSKIEHDGKGLFSNIKSPMTVTRYHSLAAEESSLPPCFDISARAEDDGEIMGIRHREHLSMGVQFHPESILTPAGKRLLGNFLNIKELVR